MENVSNKTNCVCVREKKTERKKIGGSRLADYVHRPMLCSLVFFTFFTFFSLNSYITNGFKVQK